MSLALIQGYSSSDEKEEESVLADDLEDLDDGEEEEERNNDVYNYTTSSVLLERTSTVLPPPSSALPSAFDAFSEISAPPQFLNNCVEEQQQQQSKGTDGYRGRAGRWRNRNPDKKELPSGAMSRIWTDSETDAFVTLMEEAVTAGHRADNGQFKPGTFQILARQMVEKFPECGIDRRHVKNKNKRLKDKYQTAFDMLNCSGFGWNESKQCVEVDSKQVLYEWIRRHPNKYYTPGKPFPLYPRLKFVFGRDRATGGRAENAVDAVVFPAEGETEGEAPAAEQTFDDPFDQPAPETPPPPTTSAQVFGSAASSSNTAGTQQKKGKRKMRNSEALESLAASFACAIETSKENAKVIADAITGMQGAKLGEDLVNFGLPVDEIVRAGKIFGRNAELRNIYWGLPPQLKQAYVRSLLDSDI